MGRKSLQQYTDFTVKIGGRRQEPQIVIDGEAHGIGATLPQRCGFDDCKLEIRLLRFICALALRRLGDEQGWIDADELGQLADGGASGGSVANFFRLRLQERSTGPRLIEYRPRVNVQGPGGGRFGGRSVGPYRLGVAPPHLQVDVELCYAVLLDRRDGSAAEAGDFDEALASARALAEQGAFSRARAAAEQGLYLWYQTGAPAYRQRRDRLVAAGSAWSTLADIEMEMGLWSDGLPSIRRARRLFVEARSPDRVAQTWQLEAHLLGQRDDDDFRAQAVLAARNALRSLESSSRSRRSGLNRAYYVGVLGQQLSRIGQVKCAAQKLTFAFKAAEDHGAPCWASIWAARLTQNYLRDHDLVEAERTLRAATDRAAHLTPAGNAVLVRATAEFLIATEQWDEAEVWIGRALRIGRERNMQNQVRRAQSLVAALERCLRRSYVDCGQRGSEPRSLSAAAVLPSTAMCGGGRC